MIDTNQAQQLMSGGGNVIDKETVPVERVRVDKETVTEHEQVNETARKKQIELDESEAGTRTTDRTDR